MTLELKHLTPYLPYRLKVIFEDETCELSGYNGSIHNVILHNKAWQSHINEYSNAYCELSDIKPVLRPLPDLQKEIDLELEGQFIIDGERIRGWQDLNIRTCRYNQTIYLFENHYDVFGLIKLGLAIDFNTVKHEME